MNFSIKEFTRKPFFHSEKNLIRIYLVVCVLISLKIAFLESYDNYDSFVAAFEHLKKQYDLYLMYPSEYHTEYNYSPSFAIFMGLFYYFPDWIGILLWNLTHTVALLAAIHLMPINLKKKIFIYWFCLIEYITAAENVQTNATVTALIMLVYIYQEKGKTSWSSLFFAFGFFFKIYVLTAGVFFLCFKKRGEFAIKGLGWAILFFSFPLLLVSFDHLLFLYQSWAHRLQLQAIRDSLSLIGVIGMFKFIHIDQGWIMLAGTIIMLAVLLKKEVYQNSQFRQLYLAGILIFTVVFNPGVESPTYIIAVAGAAIWYISLDRSPWHKWLLISLFIFTCLSPTELFPKYIKDHFFKPYHIKAIPCILVWAVCMIELFTFKKMAQATKSIA
jgi:hypothetical protein